MNEHTFDAVVIGAGFGGIYQLHLLKNEQGMNVRLLEKGAGIGGTWYWNKYPGALSDTEARAYRYFFDDELLEGDAWTHRYLTQSQVLGYLERVVNTFKLRDDISLNQEVTRATWNEENKNWEVETTAGERFTAKYLVTALGLLSNVNVPNFPGVKDFKGRVVHTGEWPEDLDITGKRVGVIGTGSTGTQFAVTAQHMASELTVFQRRPQYNVPSGQGPVTETDIDRFKAEAGDLRNLIWDSDLGYGFRESAVPFHSLTVQEQEEVLERAWNHGNAFRYMFETFSDIAEDEEANEAAAAFVRKKIKEIVKDPEIARKLTPTEPYARRPLCNMGYYEMFNEEHVHLVSILENPIQEFVPEGIRLADGTVHELDVVVLATGFDAVDGNYMKMDLRGRNGVTIQEAWVDGPKSVFGIVTHDFPNMFMILGPQSPFCNLPPAIETQVRFIASVIKHAEVLGGAAVDVPADVQEQWIETCQEISDHYLFSKTNSWIYGANIEGKLHRVVFYMDGLKNYTAILSGEVERGFPSLSFTMMAALDHATAGVN